MAKIYSWDLCLYVYRFAKDGANFSINSDDPTLFDNSLAADYKCALELGLTKEQIITSVFIFRMLKSALLCVLYYHMLLS